MKLGRVDLRICIPVKHGLDTLWINKSVNLCQITAGFLFPQDSMPGNMTISAQNLCVFFNEKLRYKENVQYFASVSFCWN